jgi:diguanylate cyclase (GGDEF)-like protein
VQESLLFGNRSAADGEASARSAPSLLVVDDVAENRELLIRRFGRRGFQVDEAESGARALALIEEGQYDIVLLDIMMPVMDGLEVLQRLRAKYSPDALLVIMVTGKSQSEDVAGALELGANDYLMKPVDFAIAFARVKTQVERKRAVEELTRTVAVLKQSNDRLEQEIANRKRSEARNEYLTYYDTLTGLGNRTLLKDRLSQAVLYAERYNRSVAIVYLNLDNFNIVNESLGHDAGDRLLNIIASRLAACVRESDTVVRMGGDEFVLVLLDQSPTADGLPALIQRMQTIVSEEVVLDNYPLSTTCSVGVAIFPDDGADAEALLANANTAMSRAKALGPNNCQFYQSEFNRAVQQRLRLQAELRAALAKSEFVLYFQPQVDLRSRRVIGVEALIRWAHPTLGLLPPMNFIPIAEQTGLIVALGEWVLREACRQNKAWQDRGLPPLTMAVNVSARQFRSDGLVRAVVSALQDSGLEAGFLELELTEGLIMQDVDMAVSLMRQIQGLGVDLSIDDFGTGYSSLAALKTFPVSRLKIDKSFISDLGASVHTGTVAGAVISLARKLNLRVIAEGVETDDQIRFLCENGCHEMQGFRFGRPLPAEKLEELLTSGALRFPEQQPTFSEENREMFAL